MLEQSTVSSYHLDMFVSFMSGLEPFAVQNLLHTCRMAFPSEARGVSAAVVCALTTNAFLVLSTFMHRDGACFFFIAGSAAFCVALGLILTMMCQRSYHLKRREAGSL